MNEVYIGLGTNIGNKKENLQVARDYITNNLISIIQESSIDETEPVDFLDQPVFLNQVIKASTSLEPAELLEKLQQIEVIMGKKIKVPKGPRIIDLDILLYGNKIINTNDLHVPHPEINNRIFILKHLVELNNELVDPISKRFYKDIYYEKIN